MSGKNSTSKKRLTYSTAVRFACSFWTASHEDKAKTMVDIVLALTTQSGLVALHAPYTRKKVGPRMQSERIALALADQSSKERAHRASSKSERKERAKDDRPIINVIQVPTMVPWSEFGPWDR